MFLDGFAGARPLFAPTTSKRDGTPGAHAEARRGAAFHARGSRHDVVGGVELQCSFYVRDSAIYGDERGA